MPGVQKAVPGAEREWQVLPEVQWKSEGEEVNVKWFMTMMGLIDRVEIARKPMQDEQLLALFAGGPEQAAVQGVMEICQRLEDAMVSAGIGEKDVAERAALMRDVGTVREVRDQVMSFAREGMKRKQGGK